MQTGTLSTTAASLSILLELGPSHVSTVRAFRHKAVVSTVPILTTIENETTHDNAFYEKLLTKSSTRDGCLLLFSVLKDPEQVGEANKPNTIIGSDKIIGFDKIIGMVGATFDKKSLIGDSHMAEIKGMFVSARYRRSSVGSSLMTKLHEELEKIGINNFILEVLVEDIGDSHEDHIDSYDPGFRAVKFYEKLGYQKTGLSKRRYLYDNIYYNVISMQKIIA